MSEKEGHDWEDHILETQESEPGWHSVVSLSKRFGTYHADAYDGLIRAAHRLAKRGEIELQVKPTNKRIDRDDPKDLLSIGPLRPEPVDVTMSDPEHVDNESGANL